MKQEFEFKIPPDFNPYGKLLVVDSGVNLRDLTNSRPGAVFRMKSHDAIQYIPPQFFDASFIAGMISDAA